MCLGRSKAPKPRAPSAEEKALWRAQTNLANEQAKIGRDQWNMWKEHGWPLMLDVKEKVRNWASPGRIAQQEGLAAADVKQAFGAARKNLLDSVSRFGISPKSGRFTAALRSLALGEGSAAAGAKTNVRMGILDRDLQNHMNLAGIMQGNASAALPGLASATQGLASVSSQMGQSRMHADQVRMQNYQSKQSQLGGLWAGLGMLGGSLGGAYLMANPGVGLKSMFTGMWSDERLKSDMQLVGELPGRIKVYDFKYIDDESTTYTGVSAQELLKVKPYLVDDVNGYLMVNYFQLIEEAMLEAEYMEAA